MAADTKLLRHPEVRPVPDVILCRHNNERIVKYRDVRLYFTTSSILTTF